MVGVLVAVALVTSVASCSGDDAQSDRAYPAAPTRSKSSAVRVRRNQATTVDLGGGAHLIIPPGAMAAGATVRGTYDRPPAGTWGDLNPTAHPVKLVSDPPDAIHGLLTLEFPVRANDASATGFGISTFNRATDRWTPVPSSIDTARNMVVAQIEHFSWWNPFSWDWASVFARVNQRTGEIVGKRAPAATCERHQPVPGWVASTPGITNEPAIAIRACTEGEGDVLAVEISNNRPYSMYLHYGAPVKWGWHEGGDSAEDKARNALGDRFAGTDELYIPPRGRASVGIFKLAGYKEFSIGAGWRSVGVDVLANTLGESIGKIPRAGACLSGLFAQSFGDFSPAKVRDGVVNLLDCVTQEAAAFGYFDSVTISQLESISHSLGFIGGVLKMGDIEWKLLDLYVDNFVVADTGLGAGFSVLAHGDTPAPVPTPGPTPIPTPQPTPTTRPPSTPGPDPDPTPDPGPAPQTSSETAGGDTHTWTNYTNAGGYEGPTIARGVTVQIACKLSGFPVANGNTWWYRIAQSPWNGSYYASADAFYNNGQTSGPLAGTPYVDANVRNC